MPRIREVIISPRLEEHIWVKHHVSPEEVEEVCYFSQGHMTKGRDGSDVVYGRTEAGRYVVVFLYDRGRGVFELATARDMTSAERARFRRQ